MSDNLIQKLLGTFQQFFDNYQLFSELKILFRPLFSMAHVAQGALQNIGRKTTTFFPRVDLVTMIAEFMSKVALFRLLIVRIDLLSEQSSLLDDELVALEEVVPSWHLFACSILSYCENSPKWATCCERGSVTALICQAISSDVTDILVDVCTSWSDMLLGVFYKSNFQSQCYYLYLQFQPSFSYIRKRVEVNILIVYFIETNVNFNSGSVKYLQK